MAVSSVTLLAVPSGSSLSAWWPAGGHHRVAGRCAQHAIKCVAPSQDTRPASGRESRSVRLNIRVPRALPAMSRHARDLFTTQLALLYTKPSDFWQLWELCKSSEIGPRMLGCSNPTLAIAIANFDALQAVGGEGAGIWLVKAVNGSHPIGCASLVPDVQPGSRSSRQLGAMELQVVLARSALGQGYAPEAARALIRYAFSKPQTRYLNAICLADDHELLPLYGRLGPRRSSQGSELIDRQLCHLISRRFLASLGPGSEPIERGHTALEGSESL